MKPTMSVFGLEIIMANVGGEGIGCDRHGDGLEEAEDEGVDADREEGEDKSTLSSTHLKSSLDGNLSHSSTP